MASFSYVKALEAEVADLKAELVELSGKLSSESTDTENEWSAQLPASDVMAAAVCAGLVGLAAGYVWGTRRA